nr:Chain C, epitope peptide corresponding to N-terminus of HIV-2 protease [synthetic construct]1SVZ_D Chain D, epitope peptide corresponding to N-terminus of HIV-2 protease [synthetic construct]
PQFSLWKR